MYLKNSHKTYFTFQLGKLESRRAAESLWQHVSGLIFACLIWGQRRFQTLEGQNGNV